jgi:hypothetical protein
VRWAPWSALRAVPGRGCGVPRVPRLQGLHLPVRRLLEREKALGEVGSTSGRPSSVSAARGEETGSSAAPCHE